MTVTGPAFAALAHPCAAGDGFTVNGQDARAILQRDLQAS